MFCCRELLFSKLFYRHQQQQPPPPVLRAAAGNRNLFDLARPSEPWCFAAGGCFFRSCFTGISSSSRRQQNLSTNAVFLDLSRFPDDTLGSFFRVILDLARPSEPWCFAAGSCFFRSCFTGISSSRRRHQFLRAAAGNRIFRPCSSFRAMVFCCRGLLFSKLFLPASAAATVATSPASSCKRQNLLQKPWCFYCREMLCSKLFSREQLQANRISRQMLFFLGFQTTC